MSHRHGHEQSDLGNSLFPGDSRESSGQLKLTMAASLGQRPPVQGYPKNSEFMLYFSSTTNPDLLIYFLSQIYSWVVII